MASKMRTVDSSNRLDVLLNKNFISHAGAAYVGVGEENFLLPATFGDYEVQIRNFEVYEDDVFLASFPTTVTTLANEMLWMLINNFDYEAGKEVLQMRSPLLEFSGLMDPLKEDIYKEGSIKHAAKLRRPRCIKTHLGFSLLPEQIRNGTKKPKIITILRNPKDVCISQFRQNTAMERYFGTFEDFQDLFLGGRVPFGPFWENVLSYWRQRDTLNILFIKYEDMKEDLPSVIRNVAKFLGKTVTEAEIAKLAQHLHFDSMQKNPAVNFTHMVQKYTTGGNSKDAENTLVGSGKEGGYKSVMTPELIAKFDGWTKEKIAGSGFESVNLE